MAPFFHYSFVSVCGIFVFICSSRSCRLSTGEGAPDSVGLRNLRERLTLLGVDPATAFRLFRDGDGTRAVLRLPAPGGGHA